MTPLEALIRAEIAAGGPMPLARYMALCLQHPEHGYYNRPAPIGARGAFTTAPEVSQIFGELLGLWCVAAWRAMGRPAPFTLAELGPGRGVLMADAWRAARLDPAFRAAAQVALVERSEPLRAEQRARLADAAPTWMEDISELPADRPLLLLANEFFDALPLSRWRRRGGAWRAEAVAADADGLRLVDDPSAAPPPDALAQRFPNAPEGAALETRSADAAVLAPVAERLVRCGGAALVIDYGYTDADRRAAGGRETLQALADHKVVSPLAAPGAADLTAHVNFDDLAAAAPALGAWGPVSQGVFLRRLGAEARAAALARANPGRADEIAAGLHRLTHPAEMGRLFRALALTPTGAPPPPGYDATDGRPSPAVPLEKAAP